MRVALVHDHLVDWGGAGKVVAALHQTFPDAPIYTAVYNPDAPETLVRHAQRFDTVRFQGAIQGIVTEEMRSGLARMEEGGDVALQSGEART